MIVKLIHFTGKGRIDERLYAARLLQFTKNTRLQMTPQAFNDFMNSKYSSEEVFKELEYMSSTIASSWEFVDLVFAISKISRACAQQVTRTRTASYAMQSQRVTNMADMSCHAPETISNIKFYQHSLDNALAAYQACLDQGNSLEDARGLLPMNIHCNLIAKYNLRAWVDLVRVRNSLRVQNEYAEVIQQMKNEVLAVWPWVKTFIEPKAQKAIALIEDIAKQLPPEQRTQLAKAADLLKKETA